MAGRVEQTCRQCHSNVGFAVSDDGFFYCDYCGTQDDEIVDTGMDEEQFFQRYSASVSRARRANVIDDEPISQVKSTTSQYYDYPSLVVDDTVCTGGDVVGPSWPSDFGSQIKKLSYDDYYSEIRSRYLNGIQFMINMQCKALVDKFNVSPLIVGLVGPIWLRLLASTRILADEWADQVVQVSEIQTQGEAEEYHPSATHYHSEPVNIHGKSLVMIWYKSLSSGIPISCTLAISFLVCHVAREAILPSDILRWALEGNLPYLASFSEIEKHLGSKSTKSCPISVDRMFRPMYVITTQELESEAAVIAKKIGLELPPVNFYTIASRYCSQLYLPSTEIILPTARQICDWSLPPELYLSVNEFRMPTRVCVMSILIVTIRILFDINGYGMWELSVANPKLEEEKVQSCESKKSEPPELDGIDSTLNVVELLRILEERYNEVEDVSDYSRDMHSYIQYCKDVVFAGMQPSHEDLEEEKLLTEFWKYYQNNKENITSEDHQDVDAPGGSIIGLNNKRSKKQATNGGWEREMNGDDDHHKDNVIRQMKLEMEENKFVYIPPRTRVKSKDYLHYTRKRKDMYIYAVHADYYILLRSCAKVAQVESRVMHCAVLSLEKRLDLLEKNIGNSLCLKKNLKDDGCDFCEG